MDMQQTMVIKPVIFEPFKSVVAGQSTRHGGVSPHPWQTLNLGKSTDDNPVHVAENRRRFCAALGFAPEQLAWSRQVHGDQIRVVTAPEGAEGFDAQISNVPGILLAVSVADCVPILVFDPVNQAVAAIHAGWRGTVSNIVGKTLDKMADLYGSRGANCLVYIGPCIDECSFEVGDEVAEAFDTPFKRFDAQLEKFFVDLKKANAVQCQAFGIPDNQLEVSPFSTVLHNEHFFSHRKENGVTGRMMAAIGLPVSI